MLSMKNPNISLMSTSEYLCVESESWITKYVCKWFTTIYEYFLFVYDAEKFSLLFIVRYGRIKCCKIIGFDAVNLRKNW
jgi:hypothetical protein